MSIGDLFRAKTKHSDPNVRAQAVTELGEDNLSLLAEIARDDDAFSVRRLALEKILDADTLVALSKEAAAPIDAMALERAGDLFAKDAVSGVDAEAGLAAVAKIADLGAERTLADIAVKAPLSSVKKAAVAALTDERSLADVVRYSAFEAIAREALLRIGNQGALAAIAMSDSRKSIALTALERVSEPSVIERIASKAGQKAVRAKARAMIKPADPSALEMASPERLAHAERVQLTATMESLARLHDFKRVAEFQAALDRFAELGIGGDDGLASRFDKASARYREGLERYTKRAAQRKAAGIDEPEESAEPAAAQEFVTPADSSAVASAEPMSEGEPVVEAAADAEVPNVAVVADQVATAEPVAIAEPVATTEPVAIAASAAEATVVPEATADPNAIAAQASSVASETVAAAKDAPVVGQKPAVAGPPTKDEIRVILEQLAINLESLATSEKIKTINKALARAEKKFAEIGDPPRGMPELLARLERGRQALLIRAGELREALEWQQWANVAKQEQLIARAQKLAADESAGKLGERLRNLQKEWKDLGPAPRDKAQDLWEVFKTACDVIYERVKEERKKENEVRKANMAAKMALCEQAETFAESTDWEETAGKLKRLQAEWKKTGPVPRRQSDKVWKRFRGACDAFFEKRKPHLEEQIAEFREAMDQKEALIVELEALVSEEAKATPWQQRADRFDDIAFRFQRAGRVPPREFAAFRKRQDAVEKALKKERTETRAAAQAEQQKQLDDLAATVAGVTAARSGGELGGAELAAKVLELRGQVRELKTTKVEAAIRRDFEAELRAALEQAPEAFKGTDLDPDNSRKRKEKLCKKVEKLLPSNGAAPAAASAEDMAAKLRAALADRALGGVLSKQADSQTIKRVLTEARESWARLGPVPGEVGVALEERFRGACNRAQQSAK